MKVETRKSIWRVLCQLHCENYKNVVMIAGECNLLKITFTFIALVESGYMHERVPQDQQPGMTLKNYFYI